MILDGEGTNVTIADMTARRHVVTSSQTLDLTEAVCITHCLTACLTDRLTEPPIDTRTRVTVVGT